MRSPRTENVRADLEVRVASSLPHSHSHTHVHSLHSLESRTNDSPPQLMFYITYQKKLIPSPNIFKLQAVSWSVPMIMQVYKEDIRTSVSQSLGAY